MKIERQGSKHKTGWTPIVPVNTPLKLRWDKTLKFPRREPHLSLESGHQVTRMFQGLSLTKLLLTVPLLRRA